ncbi:MAG: hypothetical protein M1818_006786 [Claussenomyces sp. TS43310]|nr:MAG: hypothetical protein M1818_006786 [Claussenomyces sp. TS43310]
MEIEKSEDEMHVMLRTFKSALSSFASSPDAFRILSSVPKHSPPHSLSTSTSTLYVLDSSFNPPTRAHLRIARTALTEDAGTAPKRLLLLLATQNADKAPKPASFEQRLAMMSIFAGDLRRHLQAPSETDAGAAGETAAAAAAAAAILSIDIGITKCPYFVDKAAAIARADFYSDETTQVHLTGFDTLIRILDPKYYPPAKTLAPLEPFLSRHRLRVTYRPDADWGDRGAQDWYLRDLKDGKRVREGGKVEWADKIEMVDGRVEGEAIISSTKVREACQRGDEEALGELVTDGVRDWLLEEKLYLDDS